MLFGNIWPLWTTSSRHVEGILNFYRTGVNCWNPVMLITSILNLLAKDFVRAASYLGTGHFIKYSPEWAAGEIRNGCAASQLQGRFLLRLYPYPNKKGIFKWLVIREEQLSLLKERKGVTIGMALAVKKWQWEIICLLNGLNAFWTGMYSTWIRFACIREILLSELIHMLLKAFSQLAFFH